LPAPNRFQSRSIAASVSGVRRPSSLTLMAIELGAQVAADAVDHRPDGLAHEPSVKSGTTPMTSDGFAGKVKVGRRMLSSQMPCQ
jgi:hypothetical protein